MTDQQLTVLRVIQRLSPRGGPVLIAHVIRALGYPKATTKHVLLELLKQGAVVLHRHDWPQSLTPAERKNMVLLAGSYYGAVSVSKRNPQTKGKKALKKAGRAIKRGAGALLGAGAEILGAGAQALANPGMSPMIAALNKQADKLKRAHNGERGNQWRSLEYSELPRGITKDELRKARWDEPITLAEEAPPYTVFFPSSRNYKKRNPRGEHLPGLPRKAQREYEHILKSAKATGRYGKRAKEVAARTVRRDWGPNPYGMSEKAWRAEENKFRKSIAAYRAKGWTYQQIKDRIWLAYGLMLDKLDDEYATFVDPFHRGGGFTLDLISPLERRRMAKKSNPKRRRNLGHKDADHPVEVTHHYRAGPPGYMTPWQRAHHAGQKQLFETGIKPAKRRNALKRAKMPAWIKAAIHRAKREGVDKAVAWETMHVSKAQRDAFDQYLVKIGHPSAYEAGSQEYRIKRFVRERMGRRNPRPDPKTGLHIEYLPANQAYALMWHGQILHIGTKATMQYEKRILERGASSNPRRRNPSFKVYLKDRFGPGLIYLDTVDAPTLAKAKDIAWHRVKSEYEYSRGEPRYKKSSIVIKAGNPTRRGMRKGYGQAKRVARTSTTHAKSYRRGVEMELRKSARGERRIGNPSAAEIRRKFAGSANGSRDLYFPKGTPPGNLAKLGRLVSITTEEGTIKPVAGSAWLCADTRGKLHLGSTTSKPLFAGPARNFGRVSKIEYEEKKPHLGYGKNPIIWFHHVGEETGQQPTLRADGAGGLVFKGGAYRITARGIEN